ncbi:unnamed protein product [Symbiodinium microadriaticum]|nr:unnamed protein product [Symbiodinium microadriaticum]
MRSSGARSWVKAAHALVKAGAAWSGHMCIAKGQTQLYLLLKAFPPPREDVHTYRSLLAACLASLSSSDDASPLTEDEQGRSALFVLCEQMSHVSQDAFPEATSMLKMVLEHAGGSIGGADRSGRTVFDLEEQVAEDAEIPYSCLRAARQLLVHAGTKSGAGRIISANGHTGVRAAAVISKSVSATVSAESSNRTDKSAQHHYSSNRRQHHTTED